MEIEFPVEFLDMKCQEALRYVSDRGGTLAEVDKFILSSFLYKKNYFIIDMNFSKFKNK